MDDFSVALRAAKRGDPAGRDWLYRRFSPVILRAVRRRIGRRLRRRYDSWDLGHSVIADLMTGLDGIEDRGERAFVRLLVVRTERKIVSKLRLAHAADGQQREVAFDGDAEECVHARDPSPETAAQHNDDRDRLRRVIASLDGEQRRVVDLRERQGLRFAEIATRLGIRSPAAARMRYARAVLAMQARWKSA